MSRDTRRSAIHHVAASSAIEQLPQPVRDPVEKARSLMPDPRVPAELPRSPPEPPGADPERHDQHNPRHCAAGRRQESFRKHAAAEESHQVREEGRVPRARPTGSRWPGGPRGTGRSVAAIGSSRVRTSQALGRPVPALESLTAPLSTGPSPPRGCSSPASLRHG
jgi:hypothetical protein